MSCALFTEEGVNWCLVLALIVAWPLTRLILVILYEVFKHAVPPVDILKKYSSNQS